MNVKKYKMGGKPIDPKKRKAAAASTAEERASARTKKEVTNRRRGESAQIAKSIAKDVVTQKGYGPGGPGVTVRKGSQDVKGSERTYSYTPQKYDRGQLREQFVAESQGRGVQPIYTTGQTLGYAPQREVSAKGLSKPTITRTPMMRQTIGGGGANRAAAISSAQGLATMDESRKKAIKLKYGGKIKKK